MTKHDTKQEKKDEEELETYFTTGRIAIPDEDEVIFDKFSLIVFSNNFGFRGSSAFESYGRLPDRVS